MFHPLSADFSGLSDEQIAAKINQLYKVIRSSRNIDIHHQASMMLDELHGEQRRRAEKSSWKKWKELVQNLMTLLILSRP